MDNQKKIGRLSFRAVCRRAGISSPNYLQMVIDGRRRMTPNSAIKIAKGLGLKRLEAKYFQAMVALSRCSNSEEQVKLMEEMTSLVRCAQRSTIDDQVAGEFYSSWLNGVIWEMASLFDFSVTEANVFARLQGLAKSHEISRSIRFLKKHGFLVQDSESERLRQAKIRLSSRNDFHSSYVRANHMKFLHLAQSRLMDPLDEREFQGLTIAVSSNKVPLIKDKLRGFIRSLAEELADDPKADQVIRAQLCLFRI